MNVFDNTRKNDDRERSVKESKKIESKEERRKGVERKFFSADTFVLEAGRYVICKIILETRLYG